MTAAALAPGALPPGFVWRQSTVTAYLRCPRRVYLEHVAQVEPDYALDGYASIAGTAIHAACAAILNGLAVGAPATREDLAEVLAEAFDAAIVEEQERGATTDPERLQPALDRLLGEQLDLLALLAADPRIAAVDWRGVEEHFDFRDAHGRLWEGTIDGWGVVREGVRFGVASGGEPVFLVPGDRVVVDWKSGDVPLDHFARACNVQLGFYRSVLADESGAPPPRAFLGALRDLERPKMPRDAQGESIPKNLSEPNPAYAAAAGLDLAAQGGLAAFEACRKRPQGADGKPIPKRLEQVNPAWLEATSKPRGPVFWECRIDEPLVAQAMADAVDGARFGFWPPSGAITGECPRCPWRGRCPSAAAGGSS